MKSRSLLKLLLLLLIAAAIPSCKSPTATTQSSAFTLILPDSTVAWGDSARMIVVPAKPLSSASVYTWSFGDSSTLSSRSDTIIHYYPDTGVFTVKVNLNDTLNKSQLGTQSGTVKVAARHFNLALLQSMKYVDLSWHAVLQFDTTNAFQPSYTCGEPYYWFNKDAFETISLNWNGNIYAMNDSSSYDDTLNHDPFYLELSTGSNVEHDNGQTDNGFTQIDYSSNSLLTTFGGYVYSGNTFCYNYYTQDLIIHNVPFISSSSSEVVFEAREGFLKSDTYNSSFESRSNFSDLQVQTQAKFSSSVSPIYFVRLRFHN